MSDKSVEEFLVGQGYNPFPLVRFTEKDVAASHILGACHRDRRYVAKRDTITPTTLFHHVQHAEEYRQTPAVGMFLRWVRFFGILASTFLLPLWLLFVIHPSLLPDNLSFIGLNKDTHIPIIMQIFRGSRRRIFEEWPPLIRRRRFRLQWA